MYLAQIPFYPANKAVYDLSRLKAAGELLVQLYPETMRCISCNSCTKVCPQDIKVMDYVNAAIRGDIAKCADLSFNCVSCGLCASRCPAEISQYHVGTLARRLYGAYIAKRAPHTKVRSSEVAERKFDAELDTLVKLDLAGLKERYNKRDMEK
jgi:Na+-translocating ferredoxin:NAD+ oxidoreductase RnfC subunit